MRLINADALKADDELTKWLSMNPTRTGKTLKMFSELFIKKIDDAPTVEERPTAEWIIDGHHIKCSNCEMFMCNTDREGDSFPRNFCPNCGAGMKGEQDAISTGGKDTTH